MTRFAVTLGLIAVAITICIASNAALLSAAEQPKPATAQQGEKPATTLAIGDKAPDFTLTGVDGNEVSLSDYAGKIVVLEWFNADCPVVKGYYVKTELMNETAAKLTARGVVWLGINSSAEGKQGFGLERNQAAVEEYSIEHPVLLDSDGKVGHLYGARTTPHVFVIGKDGKLAYQGSVTEAPFVDKPADKNVLLEAATAIADGKAPPTAQTNPFGCSVKYAQ